MSKQRETRLVIRELMEMPQFKHLSYNAICNAVYYAQYGFVHDMISNADKTDFDSFKSVSIRHIGSFIAHPKKVDLCVQRHTKKEEDEKS